MEKDIKEIAGVIPPIITPFKNNGDVDLDSFIRNIHKWESEPLAGYLVNGSNGEAVFLNFKEKITLVKSVFDLASPDRVIIAGTGCESLRETVELTNACADQGADCALVLTPHYYGGAMHAVALEKFYLQLADLSRIPILIYHVPKFSQIDLSPDLVTKLSLHSNIIGMKDSSGDINQLSAFIDAVNEDFKIFIGTASLWYASLALGIKAGIMALANCFPKQCNQIQVDFQNGNLKRALAIQEILLPVNQALTAKYGIPGLKYACDLLGYSGGHVRSPLLSCSESARKEIRGIIKTAETALHALLIND